MARDGGTGHPRLRPTVVASFPWDQGSTLNRVIIVSHSNHISDSAVPGWRLQVKVLGGRNHQDFNGVDISLTSAFQVKAGIYNLWNFLHAGERDRVLDLRWFVEHLDQG